MPPLTLYLAQLLGATLLVMAAAMAWRGAEFAQLTRRMTADPGMVLLGGVLRLVAGLALVIGHDVWSGGVLPIVVTLFGWALFLSGLLLLFAKQETIQSLVDSLRMESRMTFYAGVAGLMGLYLLGAGLLGH
jgi:hypothetical protein